MSAEAAATANNNDSLSATLPSFATNPFAYLQTIASQAPSRESLSKLAGPVAGSMKDNTDPQIAILFLQAAARQVLVETPAAAAANNNKATTKADMEAEMKSAQQLYEIADAIGYAVMHCSPRCTISKSGILPALASLMQQQLSILSNIHVEFLQACLYAEQYSYAQRTIGNSWPRSTSTVSVRQVLRYYYIRGCIHSGCNNLKMATRCFWTCLSVPADIVSTIVVAAYKKLILVQCLQDEASVWTDADSALDDLDSSKWGPLAVPRTAPSCLERFLSLAETEKEATTAAAAPPAPEDHHAQVMHMVEAGPEGHVERPAAGDASSPSLYLGVKTYMSLVKAFCRIDRSGFDDLVNAHCSLFQSDGNLGLVKQCQSELMRRQIYRLSRFYAVIPLDQLSAKVGLDAEQLQTLLLQLSVEKMWQIEMQDSMVVFPKLSLAALAKNDDTDTAEDLVQVTKMVQKLDVGIASTAKYHAIVRREKSDTKSGAPRGVEDV